MGKPQTTGNPNGRPKGSLGPKARRVERLMEARDYDPIEAMIELVTKGDDSLVEGIYVPLDIELRVSLHKELANYRYSKRRAVELTADAGPLPIVVYSGVEGAPGSEAEESTPAED